MTRCATDIKVIDNVYISRQLYNKNKKYYSNLAIKMHRAKEILKDHLDIPEDVTIRITNFKGKFKNGQYFPVSKIAEIKPRICLTHMYETLSHELVHSEQYHTGKLKTIGNVDYWNANISSNKGTTYNAYRNQPWEVEAFNRQGKLAKIIEAELE